MDFEGVQIAMPGHEAMQHPVLGSSLCKRHTGDVVFMLQPGWQLMQDEQQAKLEDMARKQEADLAKITEEYEYIPGKRLQAIRDEYAQKQREYNENASQIAARRKELDENEEAERARMEQEKNEADQKLQEKNNEYDRSKTEAEELENSYNEDLSKRQEELEKLRDEIALEVQNIKDEHSREYEELTQRLQGEYDEAQQMYKQKQDAIQKQYDEQIRVYQEDLSSKQDNFNSLVAEINQRKEAAEKEASDRYNEVAEKTKQAQQELDSLVARDELTRSEMSTALQRLQESNTAQIDSIRTSYENVQADKKKAYDDYIAEVNRKCDSLRDEIAELEKQKAIESNRLETYTNEKDTMIRDLRNETEVYLDGISDKLNLLSRQIAELDDAHKKRIVYIKTQIASTMSDYDSLLRSRPVLLSEAQDSDELDLTAQTRLFKDKLDALERNYNDTIDQLARKRDEALDKIAKEINDLDANKDNKLNEYEQQISSITTAYEALINQENERQNEIAIQVRKAKNEQDKFLANMHNESLSASSDFEEEKQILRDLHKRSLAESSDHFKQISADLKAEFDALVAEHQAISKELAYLVNRTQDIDNEIAQDELRLKYEFNSRLLDVRRLFEDEQDRKKQKLDILNIMGDGSNGNVW